MAVFGWKVVAAWCLTTLCIGTPLHTAFNEKSPGRVDAIKVAVVGLVCVLGVSSVGNRAPRAGQAADESEAPAW